MKIHALQTGTVQIKDTQQRGTDSNRLFNVLFNGSWTQPQPILAWLIEHPDGLILVDTGETSRTNLRGYFPVWHPYYRLAVRMNVQREDEIDRQLASIGFHVDDVKTVVLTHMHTDHAGGIYHFPNARFYVSRVENDASQSLAGRIAGYLPQHRPDWFNPILLDFPSTGSLDLLDGSHELASNIHIIATPGHSAGHVSVLVQDNDIHYLLAGDTSYTQDLLLSLTVDGVSPNVQVARQTLQSIHQYVQEYPTVYLPSHDPDGIQRLYKKQVAS